MKIIKNKLSEADLVVKNGNSINIDLTSIDILLSTQEINELIEELLELKKEGRKSKNKGYHIHLYEDEYSVKEENYEVTLFHEKSYSEHVYSSIIEI